MGFPGGARPEGWHRSAQDGVSAHRGARGVQRERTRPHTTSGDGTRDPPAHALALGRTDPGSGPSTRHGEALGRRRQPLLSPRPGAPGAAAGVHPRVGAAPLLLRGRSNEAAPRGLWGRSRRDHIPELLPRRARGSGPSQPLRCAKATQQDLPLKEAGHGSTRGHTRPAPAATLHTGH